jgi:hypothetical protein
MPSIIYGVLIQFLKAIPLYKANCIRVTHPCAGNIYSEKLYPFDLHVLGLPLAFILSQDQTLHSILSPYPLFPSLSGCKDTTTFSTTKYFFNFFLLFLSTTPSHPDYQYLKCLILFRAALNIFNFTIFLPFDP